MVTVVALGRPAVAVGQFASVAVSAQVIAPDELLASSVPDELSAAAVPGPWTSRPLVGRPAIVRTRVREEPRAGTSGAGLIYEVVIDYTGV